MFLIDEKEIMDYILINSLLSIEDINKNISFEHINNETIVNYDSDLLLIFSNDVKEINIKLGTIEGDLRISGKGLISFKGFPNIINGNLIAPSCSFESTEEWNVKYVKYEINLCGPNCKINNLDFLKNTEFQNLFLKVSNSMFDKSIENNYLSIFRNEILNIDEDISILYNLKYKDYNKYLKSIDINKITSIEVDDYLSSFDNNLDKEIKQCF